MGKTARAKNAVTMSSKTAFMPSIMASSLENMEGCQPVFRACSVNAASNKEVARAAQCADESRMLWIITQFLTQTANQHIDRTVVHFPVNPTNFVDDSVAAENAATIADEQG